MIVLVWVVELFDTGDLGNSELTPRKKQGWYALKQVDFSRIPERNDSAIVYPTYVG
jgi:hypothetical protein